MYFQYNINARGLCLKRGMTTLKKGRVAYAGNDTLSSKKVEQYHGNESISIQTETQSARENAEGESAGAGEQDEKGAGCRLDRWFRHDQRAGGLPPGQQHGGFHIVFHQHAIEHIDEIKLVVAI